MGWADGRLCGFDIETTGEEPDRARIVATTLVLVGANRLSHEFRLLIDPGVEIPAASTAVHGERSASRPCRSCTTNRWCGHSSGPTRSTSTGGRKARTRQDHGRHLAGPPAPGLTTAGRCEQRHQREDHDGVLADRSNPSVLTCATGHPPGTEVVGTHRPTADHPVVRVCWSSARADRGGRDGGGNVTSGAESASQEGLEGPALLEALLREKGVQPIRSVGELACDGIFDTDEELDEFLTWMRAERRANLA